MENTYRFRVKKEYVSDIIEDLLQMDAIEMLEEPEIPEWQKEEVRKRLVEAKKNPENLISIDEAIRRIDQM